MLNLLGVIANLLSLKIFSPLHRSMQFILSHTLPFMLKVIWGYQWQLRRSITQSGEYHILMSDVDMALILPLNADPLKVQKIILGYLNLKKILRFLGELEVYFSHEWTEKIELETGNFAGAISLIRDFRKLRWCELDFERYSDSYHHSKAKRAIQKLNLKLENLREKLGPWVSELQWRWLNSFKNDDVNYVHYYDRKLKDSVPQEIFQFFRCVAVGPQSHNLTPDEPLYFLRQAVHRYELLNYQAYLRVKECQIYAKDPWIEHLEISLSSRAPASKLSTENIPHILFTSEDLPEFFDLELVESDFVSGIAQNGPEQKKTTVLPKNAQMQLERSWSITSRHPFLTAWLKLFFPQYCGKLRLNYSSFDNLVYEIEVGQPSQLPERHTLSWTFPISERYGALHISHVLKELEEQTGEKFRLQICHTELPSLNFLSQLFKCKSEVIYATEPSGVIIFPTVWNLNNDIMEIRRAKQWNLPIVAGYNSTFAKRIVTAFEDGKSSIELKFDHF